MPMQCACGKVASLNYAGENAKYCAKCRSPNMVDVYHLKCIICNVKKPTLNYDGEKARYCATCKSDDMVNVSHSKCMRCNVKRASFNDDGEKPKILY